MKRILTLVTSLFIIFSAYAADKLSTVSFNFRDGTSLNPKLVLPDGSISISLTKYVLTNGLAKVSFGYDDIAAPQFYNNNPNGTELRMYRGDSLHINVGVDAEITSVVFSSQTGLSTYSVIGNIGTLDRGHSTWKNVDEDGNEVKGIHSLTFYWTSQTEGCITNIEVTYSGAQDTYTITNCSLPDNAEVSSFKELQLTFDSDINHVDNSKVTLTPNGGESQLMDVTFKDNVATLSVPDEIQWDGTNVDYTVSVKSGAFTDDNDNYNKDYETHFTLVKPLDTFTLVSTDPATGLVDRIPNVIKLTMNGTVGKISDVDCPVYDNDGTRHGFASLGFVGGGSSDVTLTLNSGNVITADGIYTITVPAKHIFDINTDDETINTYNKEIKLVYTIGETPSSEVLEKASKLLENVGVGYPCDTAKVRKTLSEMVSKKKGTDDKFNAAMEAFKADDSEIALPQTGKYYTIANITKDGKKNYLQYSDGMVDLTTDSNKAYKFLADSICLDSIAFKTGDGLYLHTLTTSSLYFGTTPNNVCEYNHLVNNLKIERFDSTKVAGLTKDDVFGKLTIYGYLGTKNDVGYHAFSLVSFNTNTQKYVVDLDDSKTMYFSNMSSSAFVITEVDPDAPEVTVAVTPTESQKTLTCMNIAFSGTGVEGINLDSDYASKITLENAYGTEYSVTVTSVDDLHYLVSFASLPKGTYTLTVEKGAFYQMFEGKRYDVASFSNTVNVTEGEDFSYDFLSKYEMHSIPVFDQDNGSPITYLNDASIYFMNGGNCIETFVKTDNTIYLVSPAEKQIASGKLVKRTKDDEQTYKGFFNNNNEYVGEVSYINTKGDAVILVDGSHYSLTDGEIRDCTRTIHWYYLDLKFDKVFTTEGYSNGTYYVHVDAETFGDENFGDYLNGASIAKSSCHVNGNVSIPYVINNSSSAVIEVNAVTSSDSKTIYDITGRRVNTMSQPGLYIVNGKKVMVK